MAAILTAVTAIVQYRVSGPMVAEFSESDWQSRPEEGDYSFGVSGHGEGRHPSASVYIRSPSGGWDETLSAVQTAADGDAIVGVARPIDGQVRIS